MSVLSPLDLDALIKNRAARVHFVGIGGTGMSAYADFRALSGGKTSGSDRAFDQGHNLAQRDAFLSRGIDIYPQDGSGIAGAAAIVVSASVEGNVADYAAASAAGIPIITRKEWLAAHYRSYPCIAITGTSGKSTVTAMTFEIFRACGRDPGLLTGADLKSLLADGGPGSAHAGAGPLILEADESDKGIADYAPETGVILNLQRDHDEPENMLPAMRAFKNNCRKACLVSDDPALASLRDGSVLYGESASSPYHLSDIDLSPRSVSFTFAGVRVTLPVPGRHNAENAAAAMAIGLVYGLDPAAMARALGAYQGVARRFEVVGSGHGIEVVDDYAHNPAKIAAVIKTAAGRGNRTIMWYQPTGYGPTRFMRPDLAPMFAQTLRPQDLLYIAPIPYIGGTVTRDISSDDLIADLAARGRGAFLAPDRDGFIADAKAEARAGDVIVVVGSRDPTLSSFARKLAAAVTG